MIAKETFHKIDVERLFHFNCSECKGWWSIGDIPRTDREMFCPWCGTKSKIVGPGVGYGTDES